MKVLNIIEDGRWAGPQKRITLVAKCLQSAEIHTTIICPSKDSDYFVEQLNKSDIPVQTLPLTTMGRGTARILRYIFLFPIEVIMICRTIKRTDCDIVHISGGAWQIKGALAALICKTRIVWHLNDTSTVGLPILPFRILSRFADTIIFASNRVRSHYNTLNIRLPSKSFNVPAPVTPSYFESIKTERPSSIGVYPRIVTVGNVNPVKGHDIFIKMCSELNLKGIDFTAEIIGAAYPTQSDYLLSLQSLIREYDLQEVITFRHDVTDVMPFLDSSDIYVCSSRAEASPTSVWEAMTRGVPVVSTDVGEVAEVLGKVSKDLIVDVGDFHTLALRVQELILDQDKCKQYGSEGHQVAKNLFDVSLVSEKTQKAYLSTLE